MEKLPELHCQCGATPKIQMTTESGKTKYYVNCGSCGRSGSTNKSPVKAVTRWNESN